MSAAAISPETPVRPQLRVISGLAESPDRVVTIDSAPSIRERQQAQLRHPSVRARRVAPEPVAAARPAVLWVRVAGYCVTLVLVILLGMGIGLTLRPASYSGETWEHSVAAGESLWLVAETVGSQRPIEDVMEDIRTLNALDSDALTQGQILQLPMN